MPAGGVVPLLVALAWPAFTSAEPHDLSVSFDREKGVAEIIIPGKSGSVSLEDLARGLARARGFDDSALAGLLPDRKIPIDGIISAIAIVALNRALAPGLHFDTHAGGLKVTMDDEAIFASTAHFRHLLLEGITRAFSPRVAPAEYGSELPENWVEAPLEKPLFLLVHGFNSSSERMGEWKGILEERGHLVATFAYPNDQPIRLSAGLLEKSLLLIHRESPGRKVKIIAHSMGGLIARAVIEDPDRDPVPVDQLIMLATPNQGTQLAHFAFGLELWELVGLRDRDAAWAEEFYHGVEDGLCGAADDLKPDSKFLTELNARPRNPGVRYSIFAGTASPLPPAANQILRTAFHSAPESSRAKRFFGAKLDPILEDMDEIGAETGDGVVSLTRARLGGVDDFVTFPFNHDTALEPGKVKGLTGAVLTRVGK